MSFQTPKIVHFVICCLLAGMGEVLGTVGSFDWRDGLHMGLECSGVGHMPAGRPSVALLGGSSTAGVPGSVGMAAPAAVGASAVVMVQTCCGSSIAPCRCFHSGGSLFSIGAQTALSSQIGVVFPAPVGGPWFAHQVCQWNLLFEVLSHNFLLQHLLNRPEVVILQMSSYVGASVLLYNSQNFFLCQFKAPGHFLCFQNELTQGLAWRLLGIV